MQLIDPKMSIDTIKSYITVWDCKGCLEDGGTQHNVMSVDDLMYLPTIEAEPIKYGRWKDIPGMERTVFCSECLAAANKELANKYICCPFCGARVNVNKGNEEK